VAPHFGGVEAVDIFDGFIWRIGAHVHQAARAHRAADPDEFAPVKLRLWPLHQLLKIKRRISRPQRQPVGLRGIVELVGANQSGGAGNVLNDDVRVARNIFRHKFREQPRVEVVNITGFCGNDDCDRFALIERSLGVEESTGK